MTNRAKCGIINTERKRKRDKTMKTYARCKYPNIPQYRSLGAGWHEVTKEFKMRYPSGYLNTIIVNGYAHKERDFEVITVIEM